MKVAKITEIIIIFQHVHLVCTLLLIITVRLVLNTLKPAVVLAAFVPVRLDTSEMMRVTQT